jgi:hypothetical protein
MGRSFNERGTTYRYQDGVLYVQSEKSDICMRYAPGRWTRLEAVYEDEAEAVAAIWEDQKR